MNIFTFLNRANATKQAIDNPRQAGTEFIKGIVEGYAVLVGFWTLVVLGVLGTLGFTDLLSGPYGWAEVIFYISVALVGLSLVGVFSAYRFIKRQVKQLESKVRSKFATKVEVVKVIEPDETI